MTKPNDIPAFPTEEHMGSCVVAGKCHDNYIVRHQGMTMRDWFAGHALTGQIASPEPIVATCREELVQNIAKMAYEYADAMLAEREK